MYYYDIVTNSIETSTLTLNIGRRAIVMFEFFGTVCAIIVIRTSISVPDFPSLVPRSSMCGFERGLN